MVPVLKDLEVLCAEPEAGDGVGAPGWQVGLLSHEVVPPSGPWPGPSLPLRPLMVDPSFQPSAFQYLEVSAGKLGDWGWEELSPRCRSELSRLPEITPLPWLQARVLF